MEAKSPSEKARERSVVADHPGGSKRWYPALRPPSDIQVSGPAGEHLRQGIAFKHISAPVEQTGPLLFIADVPKELNQCGVLPGGLKRKPTVDQRVQHLSGPIYHFHEA